MKQLAYINSVCLLLVKILNTTKLERKHVADAMNVY